MKLVVMIPALNEERTVGKVIQSIPRKIEGVSSIQIIVIDDGSTDRTRAIARAQGVDVVSHSENYGLATAFRTGLTTALKMGADIIVNTDADCQYDQTEIPKLIHPIMENKADLVLGSRFKGWIEEMPTKKVLGNKAATLLTRLLSGHNVSDAQTGFRAFNRTLASSLRITSRKTYVQETIIRAARFGFRICEIPITFRKRGGESRLIKSIWKYAFKVFPDMIRCFIDVIFSGKPDSK
jgi:glycosyltransferase involved in cell wall biosynthesis